jgi:aspartyl-tRNA(Asn)/glutamyl-tRNA(Gln) amidotransferase subunit A
MPNADNPESRRQFLSKMAVAVPSLASASEMVRHKTVSPVELTQQCLRRIEKYNPTLNAFITVMGEQALAQARELEAERQKGKLRSPIHGVPIALKDLFDTAGVRTTAGSAVFLNRVPTEDAEVVRRLKAAGAVILGKTNMHEFAYGATSVPTHFGPVHNPWNPAYIAGGSSGGSAAAVAGELCYGAMGSDTGGSIRQPSAYCGIVGIKPTYGRVSTRGVVPLSYTNDHVGPLCRTVEDATLMLSAIAGYDVLDPNCLDAPVPDYRAALQARISGLRIGIPRTLFYDQLDPEIAAAVEAATAILKKLTAGVREVQLPAYGNVPVTAAEAWAYHLPYYSKTPELYQPQVRLRLEGGRDISTAQYIAAKREIELVRRRVRDVFRDVDVLITPTTAIPPDTVENADPKVPPPGGVANSLRNTVPFDIYGLPTISVPCGFTSKGLPIGLQITANHLAEMTAISLARAYERATEWHTKRPEFTA